MFSSCWAGGLRSGQSSRPSQEHEQSGSTSRGLTRHEYRRLIRHSREPFRFLEARWNRRFNSIVHTWAEQANKGVHAAQEGSTQSEMGEVGAGVA